MPPLEADSLTIIDLEKPSRRAPLLKSSSGQKFTTGCAYTALACLIISLLLTDYTRLAFPIAIAVLPLIFLGSVSLSSRRLVLVAFALWGILVQAVGPGLFNLGEQATDINQLQQQLIQLENQRNQLQAQKNELGQQLVIFFEIKDEPSLQAHPLGDAIQTTTDAIVKIEELQPYTDNLINYTIRLIQRNERNLPDTSLIENDQRAISVNDDQSLSNMERIDASDIRIMENNLILPDDKRTPHMPWIDQKNCVSGYPCNLQSSWLQPFIDGWQYITTAPLMMTWFFWLSLLLIVPGIFLFLRRNFNDGINRPWTVTYRLLYSGPLSGLKDAAFPDQRRQKLPPEASILKIVVTSTRYLLKQGNMGNEAQDLLYLNPGPGTSVYDVLLAQGPRYLYENLSAVTYSTTTGNIVVSVKPMTLAEVKMAQRAVWRRKANLPRQFPLQFYVVVDYFAGPLNAATPHTAIEQIQEQRAPNGLVALSNILQQLNWWIFATGFYIVLSISSTIFFERSAPSNPQIILWFGLGGLIVALAFTILVFIIKKATMRRPDPLALNLPVT